MSANTAQGTEQSEKLDTIAQQEKKSSMEKGPCGCLCREPCCNCCLVFSVMAAVILTLMAVLFRTQPQYIPDVKVEDPIFASDHFIGAAVLYTVIALMAASKLHSIKMRTKGYGGLQMNRRDSLENFGTQLTGLGSNTAEVPLTHSDITAAPPSGRGRSILHTPSSPYRH